MWNYEAKRSRLDTDDTTSLPRVFLDIGANVGSCVLQMLLETNAIVLAFEPNPRNLLALTSTLKLLPQEIRERAYVFPIGIGDERGSASITNDLRTNAGATMLSPKNDGNGGVVVEPLDAILSSIMERLSAACFLFTLTVYLALFFCQTLAKKYFGALVCHGHRKFPTRYHKWVP